VTDQEQRMAPPTSDQNTCLHALTHNPSCLMKTPMASQQQVAWCHKCHDCSSGAVLCYWFPATCH